jgi:uncharacterized protein
MSNVVGPGGISGCFRCGFVWRPRVTNARLCPRCKSRLWDSPVIRPVRGGSGLGIEELVSPKRKELARVLAANKARNPRVFGSVARREANRGSDLDLLVDFEPGASALDQVELMIRLREVFRRKVEVTSPQGLHWLVRPQVLFEAIPV